MGTTMQKISRRFPTANQSIATVLSMLDKHVIFSKQDRDYRYNILDLHNKVHPSTITTKNGVIVPHDKQWAFGHIMIINNEYYFSSRPTPNREIEEHGISSTIYSNLSTTEIFDIDRNAKLIDNTNVNFIVNSILSLRSQGLIP